MILIIILVIYPMFSTWFNYIFNNAGDDMPDPKKDIEKISKQYSNHITSFTKAYPLLIQDNLSKDFCWTIVLSNELDDYDIKIDDSEYYHKISDEIKDFIKRFPIYLDHEFGNLDSRKGKFMVLQYEMMCKEFWDEFVNIYREAIINALKEKGYVIDV